MIVDWVSARAKCVTEVMFDQLVERIKEDVAEVNKLNRSGVGFNINHEAFNQKCLVYRIRDFGGGVKDHSSVIFELSKGQIVVTSKNGSTGHRLFNAKPALTLDARCLVEIEGVVEPQELWQVSRKALEDLFFGF